MQAPKWLPYRLSKRWDHARVVHAVRGLRKSQPLPVVAADSAQAEIHMLLCRRDAEIGVLALKSLLRFDETAWAVAITDDGSITPKQRNWINSQIPGCRWLPRVVADERIDAGLADRPRLQSLYHSDYQPLRKLIHPLLLADCSKVLVLDPDTIFFRSPDRIAQWVANENAASLFLHDHQDQLENVPPETWEAFEELRQLLAPTVSNWSMPHCFFNSGLLAYSTQQCNLDNAELYLQWLSRASSRYKSGKPGLWFGPWTPEQTAYQVIFATMDPPAEPLGNEYRIGNKPGHVFNHFLWLQLVKPASLVMLKQVVLEIASLERCPG